MRNYLSLTASFIMYTSFSYSAEQSIIFHWSKCQQRVFLFWFSKVFRTTNSMHEWTIEHAKWLINWKWMWLILLIDKMLKMSQFVLAFGLLLTSNEKCFVFKRVHMEYIKRHAFNVLTKKNDFYSKTSNAFSTAKVEKCFILLILFCVNVKI